MRVRVIDVNNIEEAKARIRSIGADPYSVPLMAQKAVFKVLLIERIDNRAANFLKQDMLSIGGETAVSREVGGLKKGQSNVLVMGTLKQLGILSSKIAKQPFGLSEIAKDIDRAVLDLNRKDFAVKCGSKTLRLGKFPVVMGILNVTPDSFSDGGRYFGVKDAVERARCMVEEGAGIIDIGGESTRPGSERITPEEEIRRIIPVIKRLAKTVKVPISVDTYKPDVARAAAEAGAEIINDITALRYKKGRMADFAAKIKLPVILMHMRGAPKTMQKKPEYKEVVPEIISYFTDRLRFAAEKGIKKENVIIDPGIGFGKTLEHNLEILNRLDEFKILGRPVAAGVSRKSFIGKLTGIENADERLAGSLASSVWCAARGAKILRVHDVKETVQALKVLNAVMSS
ncbi:MAG: dihydropteroate synthase [Elusimicrobiota bacterium]